MDTFTFLIAILFVMLALQYGQNWMVFAIVAVMILSTRSMPTIMALVVGVVLLYFLAGIGALGLYWPIVVFGLIIIALALGLGEKKQQPEYYTPDMGYGDMFGGM